MGKKSVEKMTPAQIVHTDFKVWRTIKLGTGLRTAVDFREALRRDGCRISDWASDLLGQPAFTASATETKLQLVVVSVAELGFTEVTPCRDIYKQAQEFWLGLCPPEIGPQLRLQYKDQPMGEWLVVGMEPIADADDDLHVFYVGCSDDDLWLRTYRGRSGPLCHPDDRFVFVLSK